MACEPKKSANDHSCPGLSALLRFRPDVNLIGIDSKPPLVIAIEQQNVASALKLASISYCFMDNFSIGWYDSLKILT